MIAKGKKSLLRQRGKDFMKSWLATASKHETFLGVWYNDLVALTIAVLVPLIVQKDISTITVYGLTKWLMFCWEKRKNFLHLSIGIFALTYFAMAVQGIIITFFTPVGFFAALGVLNVLISSAKYATLAVLTYQHVKVKRP